MHTLKISNSNLLETFLKPELPKNVPTDNSKHRTLTFIL